MGFLRRPQNLKKSLSLFWQVRRVLCLVLMFWISVIKEINLLMNPCFRCFSCGFLEFSSAAIFFYFKVWPAFWRVVKMCKYSIDENFWCEISIVINWFNILFFFSEIRHYKLFHLIIRCLELSLLRVCLFICLFTFGKFWKRLEPFEKGGRIWIWIWNWNCFKDSYFLLCVASTPSLQNWLSHLMTRPILLHVPHPISSFRRLDCNL